MVADKFVMPPPLVDVAKRELSAIGTEIERPPAVGESGIVTADFDQPARSSGTGSALTSSALLQSGLK